MIIFITSSASNFFFSLILLSSNYFRFILCFSTKNIYPSIYIFWESAKGVLLNLRIPSICLFPDTSFNLCTTFWVRTGVLVTANVSDCSWPILTNKVIDINFSNKLYSIMKNKQKQTIKYFSVGKGTNTKSKNISHQAIKSPNCSGIA